MTDVRENYEKLFSIRKPGCFARNPAVLLVGAFAWIGTAAAAPASLSTTGNLGALFAAVVTIVGFASMRPQTYDPRTPNIY